MGDVITTLAGKTVEVYNTDAEGRLVLCDGITFAQRMGARTVIDLATLTYSAQSALGDQVVALFGNDREVLRIWEETAEQTGEYYWQLPMGPIYHKMIEWSICADFANYAPGKGAGASVAACFLENFVEDGTQWIHLDMVGPSVVRKETDEMAEGASGACMSTWRLSDLVHRFVNHCTRACLKNDFHKLGLAAHEKLFSDTLRIAIHGRRSYENRREGK